MVWTPKQWLSLLTPWADWQWVLRIRSEDHWLILQRRLLVAFFQLGLFALHSFLKARYVKNITNSFHADSLTWSSFTMGLLTVFLSLSPLFLGVHDVVHKCTLRKIISNNNYNNEKHTAIYQFWMPMFQMKAKCTYTFYL